MKSIEEGAAINKDQIKKIHTLKSALKMPDDKYRNLMYINFYRATSSKQLTFEQAEIFIKHLESAAIERGVWKEFYGKSAYEDLGSREGMAKPEQLRRIEATWKDVSRNATKNKRSQALRGWLYKYFNVSDLRFVDSATALKIIHALKEMQARGLSKERQEDSGFVSRDRAMGDPF